MAAILVFWILCGIAGSMILGRFNKAGTGCLLGGLLGPIGLLIAWTMRDDAKIDERQPIPSASTGTGRVERECPYCAELILAKAKVCKHCGRDVDPVHPKGEE